MDLEQRMTRQRKILAWLTKRYGLTELEALALCFVLAERFRKKYPQS